MKRNTKEVFYVLDTETTGLNPLYSDAIEVSVLKVRTESDRRFEILDELDCYINPHYPLPEEIVEFNRKNQTGITDEFLKNAPDAEEVTQKMLKFLEMDSRQEKSPFLVGHNLIQFDYGFINKLYSAYTGKDLNCRMFDTLLFARKYQSCHGAESNSLSVLFQKTQKRHSNACPKFHTSIADCYATLDVLEYLLDIEETYSRYSSADANRKRFKDCVAVR